jgi:hypothetical protein
MSVQPPARYTLHFEWPGRRPKPKDAPLRLIAETLEDAQLEAALLYACADGEILPTAYRIVRGARRVVFRYAQVNPEDAWRPSLMAKAAAGAA